MRKKINTQVSNDLNQWLNTHFTIDRIPKWVCPTCKIGTLSFDKQKFHSEETSDTKRNSKDPDFELDWARFNFVALLKCNNNSCQETVTVLGDGRINEYSYPSPEEDRYEYVREEEFYPIYFNPPLNLFDIPTNCPKVVTDEIITSFSLFFADLSASANRIRSVIELILNDRNVKSVKVETSGKGKKTRKNLSLHQRILEFMSKEKEIANHLLAIKWIGNPASHAKKINALDLLDSYEILKLCLEKLYDDREKRVNHITKTINKRRRPRTG